MSMLHDAKLHNWDGESSWYEVLQIQIWIRVMKQTLVQKYF